MPPMTEKTELSDLLRELEQGSAAILRNTINVKRSLYGSVPASEANKAMMHDSSTAVGVLRKALNDIGHANDDLVFLRDSCDLNLKGQDQTGDAPPSEVNRASRY
ncbi:MAG TPA: hypothetical protein VGN44_05685 [Candidatus Angelobacter sp.]